MPRDRNIQILDWENDESLCGCILELSMYTTWRRYLRSLVSTIYETKPK